MKPYLPQRVYYEPQALEYELGRRLLKRFQDLKIPVKATSSHNRVTGLPGKTAVESYRKQSEL
jgi:spore photoproduct lyase